MLLILLGGNISMSSSCGVENMYQSLFFMNELCYILI